MITPLDPVFHLELHSGQPKKIFMSFGLLSRLAGFVGDDAALPQIFSDIELQNVIVSEILSLRDVDGTIKKRMDPLAEDAMMTIEEGHRLMVWVSEHLTDFFAKRLHATLEMQNRMKSQIRA